MGVEWLVILGLAAWVFAQSQRLKALSNELDALKARLDAPTEPAHEAWTPTPANEDLPELLLTEALPPVAPAFEIDDAPLPTRAFATDASPLERVTNFFRRHVLQDLQSGWARDAALAGGVVIAVFAFEFALRMALTHGQRLDPFTENAFRALALIGGGYAALPRYSMFGLLARWGGHALLAAGAILGVVGSVLWFNPWWGSEPARLASPFLNTTLIAFAAPAALTALAARRCYPAQRDWARTYACLAVLFAACFLVLALRRLLHGAELTYGSIALGEGDAYGLLALAGASGLAYARERLQARAPAHPFTADLDAVASGAIFTALFFGAVFLLFVRNAWWGGQTIESNAAVTALASLSLAPAAAAALWLGATAPERAPLARFASALSVSAFALTFGFLLLRWGFHQGAMDDSPRLISVEGLFYGLWPLVFILAGAALILALSTRARTTELALDFDAIWAVAPWSALIFTGLSLWAFFNPWRGIWPAHAAGFAEFALVLLCYLLAALLSFTLSKLTIVQRDPLLPIAAKIAAAIHIFTAIMLMARRAFHGDDMATGAHAVGLESWTYTAIWMLFAAVGLAFVFGRRWLRPPYSPSSSPP